MTIQHEDITDPFVHEPKGAAAAVADTVYVADGAGSGTWEKITEDSLDAAVETGILAQVQTDITAGTITLPTFPEFIIKGVIADVSTAETIYFPIPADVTVREVVTVLEGAITSADSIITVKNNAGTSMGTITVAEAGSGAGDVDTLTPASNNTVTAPGKISVESDGGSTGTQRLWVALHCTGTTYA